MSKSLAFSHKPQRELQISISVSAKLKRAVVLPGVSCETEATHNATRGQDKPKGPESASQENYLMK